MWQRNSEEAAAGATYASENVARILKPATHIWTKKCAARTAHLNVANYFTAEERGFRASDLRGPAW